MMNQYSVWKYLLIVGVIVLSTLYALPNIYGHDPAVQVTSTRSATVDASTQGDVDALLKRHNIKYKSLSFERDKLLIRFNDDESQLKAKDIIKSDFEQSKKRFTVALNLAASTPSWLTSLGALPMYLGLDLRGGVHFLMQVDMVAALDGAISRYSGDVRILLRESKIRYVVIENTKATEDKPAAVEIRFRELDILNRARATIGGEFPDLVLKDEVRGGQYYLRVTLSDNEMRDTRTFALKQNITTLRNRVNELGVAEPIVQQQGQDRIVIQLPGVQDTGKAKEILGATATLEYRLADVEHDVQDAVNGRVPAGSRLYYERNGDPILLKRSVIVTGDQVTDASSGLDSQNGSPAVYVTLDGKGARKMGKITRENIGRPMAVVFIENIVETRIVNGKPVRRVRIVEEVINVATIRDSFSNRFQTTGLDSTTEAHTLALLLRAGALAAPIEIVEERTVGPSLGQQNIDQGKQSVMIGFIAVLIFMAVWYRGFGWVANLALTLNLVIIFAVLSLLQATLTLPGIAGIVLTVGMAVDANVLIFERIREEIKNGNSPQASIHAGYEKAFSTIADANITTLIAALVLFSFGTGPIKGFAITLSIGILTSMFTAIFVTRGVVNLTYGKRRVTELSI
jgi:preprotein translocase subunit SecD